MLSISDALSQVLNHAFPLRPEVAALTSSAIGQVIATSVQSDIDSPPYAKATMDGYALRSEDIEEAGVTLRVIEEVVAGRPPMKFVETGEASRIMTGAPIPDGADAVVPHEKTESLPDDRVRINAVPKPGEFILPQGREMRVGETVVSTGTLLTPQVFGLLASVGRTTVTAYPHPRVAILSTGDEVVEPMVRPGPGQLRNSNGTMLLAQSVRAGALPRYLGIARDNVENLRSLIGEGLSCADVLILSGGVSAGKLDLVPQVLAELGVNIQFHKVSIKPGKPLLFGTRGDTLVFGLPGNPVSSFVGFEAMVRPAIRKLAGHEVTGLSWTRVPLTEGLTADNDRPTLHPGKLTRGKRGEPVVQPLPWFGSADLRALLAASALIGLPPGKINLVVGTTVPILHLNES